MIDAQAIVDQLERLRSSASDKPDEQLPARLDWIRERMQQLPVTQGRSPSGSYWITLAGVSEKTVVLGSGLLDTPNDDRLDSNLGLVTGLEAIRALAQRYDGRPPCTVQLVLWAEPRDPQPGPRATAFPAAEFSRAAAYLELQLEPGLPLESGAQLEPAGTPLGVAVAVSAPLASTAAPIVFNPRLTALCDEAIRELTGKSASVPATPPRRVAEVASIGIPVAMMYVQAPGDFAEEKQEKQANAARLRLLQAAEAFGRWAEATMHLVAGDELDLWAREHRTPHL